MEHGVDQGEGLSAQALDGRRASRALFMLRATNRNGQQPLAKASVSLL